MYEIELEDGTTRPFIVGDRVVSNQNNFGVEYVVTAVSKDGHRVRVCVSKPERVMVGGKWINRQNVYDTHAENLELID